MPYTNSPMITVKRNVYAVKLNDKSFIGQAWREQSSIELFTSHVISSGWVDLKTYIRVRHIACTQSIDAICCYGCRT